MEKKNNMVILLLLVIIAILVVLCVLFATGIISFSSNNKSKIIENNTEDTNENKNTGSTTIISSTNGKLDKNGIIIISLLTNETVRSVFDNPQVTHCKSNNTRYTEEELGLNYVFGGFYKSIEYNTYADYINNIKQYFTDEYYKNNFENKYAATSKSFTSNDGTILYYYYEKDGALYCASTNKGGDIGRDEMKELNYNITNVNNEEIEASIEIVWNYDEEKANIKVINDNGDWKISSYEVQ